MSRLDRDFAELRDKVGHKFMTATGTITVRDQSVHCDTTGGAIAITLPSVAEAAGKIFSFFVETGGTNAITFICPNDDAANYAVVEALDYEDAGDGCVLMSDGYRWLILYSHEAD